MIKFEPYQIEQWVSRHFEYKFSKNNTQLRICNPDGDTKFNLYINLKYERNKKGVSANWVHDFRVNHQQYDGSFIRFVMNYKNLSYYKAVRDVVGKGSSVKDLIRTSKKKSKEQKEEQEKVEYLELPPHSEPFIGSDKKLERIFLNYLHGRAVTDDIIQKNMLHYTPSTVVFPYMEYDELVYWQERSILGKSFNFPDETVTGLSKADYLYGFDNVEHSCEALIVVESIFNCLTIGGDCIATGGASISDNSLQVKKLCSFDPGLLILAPDADEAGILSLKKNFYVLRKKFKKLAYSIPPDKDLDWNDMDREKPGSSREYIENNVFYLNVVSLSRLLERIKVA